MSKQNSKGVGPQKKIKILAYCDSPTCATGFATVSRNILGGLYSTGKYDIDILGINYWGEPHNFPFRIWPTGINNDRDPYGRKKVFQQIQQMDFDILFFLQDTFILDFLPELHMKLREQNKKFKSICYYPVDGTPKDSWLKNVNACDYLIAYSEFGKEESIKALPGIKIPTVIPHGVNTKDYFPVSKNDAVAFREHFFGTQANKFIFTNLNRNQQRKDIPRTIAAFAKFHKEIPQSLLYLHMAKKDQGWDLPEVVKAYDLSVTEDVIFPENFGPNQGYPRNIVNMIYNASDCVVSTTLGEGWGLCLHKNSMIFTTDGAKEIKNITIDDRVILGGKDFAIKGISTNTKDKAYKIKMCNNQELIVSKEHKIPTMEDIYKSPPELTIEDHLIIDKAKLYTDISYTYDLSQFSDGYDDKNVWKKMEFSSDHSDNISNIMSTLDETKKIVETAIKVYRGEMVSDSDRVTTVVDYLETISYKRPIYKLNRYVEFTPEFARLLGYYVAEGSNENGKGIEFSFHTNEEGYHADVESLMLKYFNVTSNKKISKNRCSIRYRSSILAKFFGTICGVGSNNKHIPILCLQHVEKAKEFLKGYWAGDGHFGDVEFSCSTASNRLKEELMFLLSGFNIFSKSNLRESTGSWSIYINGEDYNIMADLLSYENRHNTFKKRNYLEKMEDCFFIKIKSIEEIIFPDGDAFMDLCVETKEHFVANGIVVHNSWIEAMATKTPVIMPRNTAMIENITEDRGWLVNSGSNPSLFTIVPNDNEVIRPLVDVDDMVKVMKEVYFDTEESKKRANNAYNWVATKMEWENSIILKWQMTFDIAYKSLLSNTPPKMEHTNNVIATESF